MSASELRCPSCGASLPVESRFTRTVVCGFCNQVSHLAPAGLSPVGTGVALAQFPSMFSVGKRGRAKDQQFTVMGRLRFQYEDGFWDEWYLRTGDGRQIWLQEDEGEFVAFEKETLTTVVPPYEGIRVGSTIEVNSHPIFVVERGEAIISGGEGEIPFRFFPGEGFFFVDGNSQGKAVSIEFGADEIGFFVGEPLTSGEIQMSEVSEQSR